MRGFWPLLLVVCSLPVTAQTPAAPPGCRERLAEDFVPMTPTERLREAQYGVASLTPFFSSAIRAGLGQHIDQPREWGEGAAGFGRRFGSIYAETFIGQMFEQGVSYKLHEDNRYFGSGQRNPARRFGYAIASTILARRDDGSRTISISAIGGAATGAFVSRAWQPRSTTSAGDAAVSFGLTMAVRAGFNVLREFAPHPFARVLK